MFYLLLASIIWSFSWGLIKSDLTDLDPTFVAFLRLFIALPVFLPFMRWKIISTSIALKLLLIGAIQYGLMYVLCIAAYQYLPAYQVVLFASSTPIYLVLFDNVIEKWSAETTGKRFNFTYLILAIVACFGAGVIHFQPFNFSATLKGFLLVQVSDMCFAAGQLMYRRLMKKSPHIKDLQVYALLFIGASLITCCMVTVNATWYQFNQVTMQQILIIIYLGAIASGFAFFLWNKGTTMVDIGTLAVMNNFKIPLGIFVSVVIFGENANLTKLTSSMVIILSAITYARWYAEWSFPRKTK